MDDLESAATEALEEGRGLATEVETALRVLTDASESVTRARESVQAEWDRFTEEASALGARVAPDQGRVAEAAQQALDALGELGNGVEELRGESEADAQEVEAATQGVGAQADALTPGATALGEELEGAFDALAEQATALAGSIDGTLDGLHTFLAEEVPAGVDEMIRELRQAGEDLQMFLEETAGNLEEAYETWESGVAEAEAVIERLFGQLDDGLEQSVDEAVNRATAHYDEAWPALAERAVRIEQELAALDVAVAQAGADSGDSVSALGDEIRASAAALAAARARLLDVQALLASYTFVSA